jgi:hypothetical protein
MEMAIFKVFGREKRRKYPIKRDENGKTARKRCFEMFQNKVPLPEIAKTVGVKIDTVYKYHQQWARNPKIEQHLAYYKWILDKSAPDRERSKETAANLFGISKEQLDTILQKSYGLRRLLSGKIYFPVQADAAHKRYIAMELAIIISDHLLKHGGKIEDVYFAFRRWMQQYQLRREEEDEYMKEENKDIMFMRRVIEADLEIERRGRVQPERLSAEERDTILKWGVQSVVKQMETMYWIRISLIIAEGNTIEQAREKIYQGLLNNGDIEGAKRMRQYQDVVHPLKTDNKQPPSTPEPPAPT